MLEIDKESLFLKYQNLLEFFKNKIVVVAFSGGIDSTLVSEIAFKSAKTMVAVTADSITVLPGEVEKAKQLAMDRGWTHRIVKINELQDTNFSSNPSNRCYYCKAGLSEELKRIADEINAEIIVEGTNFTEVSGNHRPGLVALREQKVTSPLLEAKLTKEEVRELAEFLGLPNSQKPSLACLSSRFPYGVQITPEKLKRVGLAERYILDTYSIKTLRVRDHEGLARIEVAPEERKILLKPEIMDDLHKKLKSFGFDYVSIDCRGYKTGSLNDVLLVREF